MKLNNYTFDNFKYLNYLFIIYAFVLPLSKAAIAVVSGLIIILWLFDSNISGKKSILKNHFIQITLLFFMYKAFTLLYSDNIITGISHLRHFWYYLVLFALYTSLDKKNIQKVLSSFLFGMLVSEIISYGIFFGFWITKRGSIGDPTPFMNHLNYSLFLAVTSLILLSRIIMEKSLKIKSMYLIFFMTATSNLFLVGGRSGQLSFIVGVIGLIIYQSHLKFKAFIIGILLVSTILFTAYTFSETFQNRIHHAVVDINKILVDKNYNSSFGRRISEWIVVKEILTNSPIFGIGIGDIYEYYYTKRNTDSKFVSLKTDDGVVGNGLHSDLSEALAGGGLIAGGLLIAIFIVLYRIKIINLAINNLKIITIIAYVIGFVSDPFLRGHFTAPLFTLLTGLIIVQERKEIDDSKKQYIS